MTVRRRALAALGLAVVALGVGVACGEGAESSFGDNGNAAPDGGTGGFTGPGDGGPTAPATGVLLLHNAAFPAFRVCFENYGERPPMPDSNLMPEANIVGVDVGSVVRLPPMEKAPGKVFVFDVSKSAKLKAHPGATGQDTCAKLRSQSGLEEYDDYLQAGEITRPIGVDRAEVLAITGCTTGPGLIHLGIPTSDCPGYDLDASAQGSLSSIVIPLQTTTTATTGTLPVQVYGLSDKLNAAAGNVAVSFGALNDAGAAPLDQPITSALPYYDASDGKTLDVNQTSEPTFGAYGFRVTDGRDGGVVFDESLADIQARSRPDSTPTLYFLSASNYAMLLLGDPTVTATLGDGGANPNYPRRALHFLAVPVREETDAGAPVTDAAASDAAVP